MGTISTLLAYGEFKSTDFWGRLAETLPFFLRWTVPPLVLYLLASAVCELPRGRIFGPLLFLLVWLLGLPHMFVMGAWGPAHVAMKAGEPAWLAFLALIVIKAAMSKGKGGASSGTPCRRCGYDTSGCGSSVCPECGAAVPSPTTTDA
jgi:ribosomal protein L37E